MVGKFYAIKSEKDIHKGTVISTVFADIRRRNGFWLARWLGGLFIGIGGFQLYDGIIQHKLMRLHQIRYVENVIVYDIVWNVIAILLLLIGIYFMKRKPNHKGHLK